jgi:uncharacterized protein YqhQ
VTAADEHAERLSDGTLVAKRDAPVGGQAVLEGVMMRGVSTWAVAVRMPEPADAPESEREIRVESFPLVSVLKKHRLLRLPIIRGGVALWESLAIGFKALGISANAQLPDPDQEISQKTWTGTIVVALAMSVGLFFLLPATIANLSGAGKHNGLVFVVVEKLIRISIFLGYLWLISRMKDLQRVFQYHGAEHKTISCYEAGMELTPENAQRFSRLHPRCGTSFLLIVMIVAIVVFAPFGKLPWIWLFVSRIVGIPIVAGIAFEAIKWFGRNRAKRWARVLMWPGLQLQRLTTREPSLDQLAVAIVSLEEVLKNESPDEISEADRLGIEVAA